MTVRLCSDSLPETMQELERVLGSFPALRLMAVHGGGTISIPVTLNPKHRLAEIVGLDAMTDLVAHFGGELLYIPKPDKRALYLRNQIIIQRYNEAEPVKKIAKDYKLTERQVWRILKKPLPPIDPKNPASLFFLPSF